MIAGLVRKKGPVGLRAREVSKLWRSSILALAGEKPKEKVAGAGDKGQDQEQEGQEREVQEQEVQEQEVQEQEPAKHPVNVKKKISKVFTVYGGKRHSTKAARANTKLDSDTVIDRDIDASLEELGDPFDNVDFVTKKKFALSYYFKHLKVIRYT